MPGKLLYLLHLRPAILAEECRHTNVPSLEVHLGILETEEAFVTVGTIVRIYPPMLVLVVLESLLRLVHFATFCAAVSTTLEEDKKWMNEQKNFQIDALRMIGMRSRGVFLNPQDIN